VNYLHIHLLSNVLNWHRRVSPRRPVFADSRIALLCNALCTCHAPLESCPFPLLVHWAFRASYINHLLLLHHASLPQNWSVQTSIPMQQLWAPRWCFCVACYSHFHLPSENPHFCQMTVWTLVMMIAVITINSGLVSLIEGLCAQILYSRFEIIEAFRSHVLLFFFGGKNLLKKKAVSPRSYPAS